MSAAFGLMVTDDGQDTQKRTGDLQQVDSMPGWMQPVAASQPVNVMINAELVRDGLPQDERG